MYSTKAIIKQWKQSTGLHENYLKTLSPNQLQDILDTQHDDLDYLKIDLSELQQIISRVEDYTSKINTIMQRKLKEDECNE